jgi:putative transposase
VRTLILGLYLNLRDLEEMMAERGIRVDHSTIDRWAVGSRRYCRSGSTGESAWSAGGMSETYIKARGQWMYLSSHRQCRRYGRVLL